MLISFNSMNESFDEVNVSYDPMYRLVDAELFKRLMERSGTGARVTYRDLAATAGVSLGTISNILNGTCKDVPFQTAAAMTQRIGVDLLVAFEPVGRSNTTPAEYAALTVAEEMTA